MKTILGILGVLAAAFSSATCEIPESGIQQMREAKLSDRYSVKWQANFDKKSIQVWLDVETTGYVGFGLSPFGSNMIDADILIVGMKNGELYFNDYHGGSVNGMPKVDKHNDWTILNANESNGHTKVHLQRLLNTCDEEDKAITEGTMKMIWAIGESDEIQYHKAERGASRFNMLDPPTVGVDLSVYDVFDITTTMQVTSNSDTFYWCSLHKRAQNRARKSYIVAIETILTNPQAINHTHHLAVLKCHLQPGQSAEEIFEPHIGAPPQNSLEHIPGRSIPRQYCNQAIYAWNIGGGVLTFPENIGLPWGEEETEYFFFDIHLDNQGKQNTNVTMGVSFYYTYEKREIEAGIINFAYFTSPGLLIPPNTKEWTLAGHCGSECTQTYIPEEGISLFNLQLHTHKSGKKIKVRHFRGNKELPWIAHDPTFDFDYQENRPLSSPLTILPKDHITIECTYDSRWKQNQVVMGGWGVAEEMCIAFTYYYPVIKDWAFCSSGVGSDWIYQTFGITNATMTPDLDPVIHEPKKWKDMKLSHVLSREVNWTDDLKSQVHKEVQFGHQKQSCNSPFEPPIVQVNPPRVTYPKFNEDYKEINECPSTGNAMMHTSIVTIIVTMIMTVLTT